jgi:hypothetical protein
MDRTNTHGPHQDAGQDEHHRKKTLARSTSSRTALHTIRGTPSNELCLSVLSPLRGSIAGGARTHGWRRGLYFFAAPRLKRRNSLEFGWVVLALCSVRIRERVEGPDLWSLVMSLISDSLISDSLISDLLSLTPVSPPSA